MGETKMSYIKGRLQRYSHSLKKWLLVDISNGKIVGKSEDKYPYVRVLRVIRSR
jgi:hypothetical protein